MTVSSGATLAALVHSAQAVRDPGTVQTLVRPCAHPGLRLNIHHVVLYGLVS